MALRYALLGVVLAATCLSAFAAAPAYDNSFSQFFSFDAYCKDKWYCQRLPNGVVQLLIKDDDMGGFTAKQKVHYGMISMEMKLPAGYSGGTVPCFYMIDNLTVDYHTPHDEIDFEFFGGKTPGESLISTNLLSGGQQFTEQFYFPFDPSADFHRYTLIWTPKLISWLVDGTPIRVTENVAGKPFPSHWLTLRVSDDFGCARIKQTLVGLTRRTAMRCAAL